MRFDDPIAWLVGAYFPPHAAADPGVEWTDYGTLPSEDAALIQRMLSSQSAGAAFGNRPSFMALWDADPLTLGRAYPDPNGRPYDASSADAALAQHLAFWTRKDCERIRRLMLQSKLNREKWTREDYLPRTILKAVAMQVDVLALPSPPKPPVAAAPPESMPIEQISGAVGVVTNPGAELRSGFDYLTPTEQPAYFEGCVYVVSLNRVLIPGGHLLSQSQFDVVYGGKQFALDNSNSKVAKGAWDCFAHSQALKFPRAHSVCFRPELPAGAIITEAQYTLVNTYSPVTVDSSPGDIGPFLHHMRKLFPIDSDRAIIEAYLAALVQFPGDKFQWWPLIQGAEGNGKSLILAVAEAAIGPRYCHRPNASDLGGNGGKFTAWLMGRVLIGIEEIKVGNRIELLEILKPIVTNDRLEMQGKGVDQITGDNRANGLLFTNYKDAIPASTDRRRYAQFFTPQQSIADIVADGMGGDYFPRLYTWLRSGGFAHVTHWLQHYPIPAALNPAMNHGGQSHRAPTTSSQDEALAVGMGRIEQEVSEAIARGEPGFSGGWISSVMLTNLLREIRASLSPYKQREMLRGLGYTVHPGLVNGRVNNVVTPDGKKPILYVKAGHLSLNAATPADVARMYSAAQPNAFGAPLPAGAVPAAPLS